MALKNEPNRLCITEDLDKSGFYVEFCGSDKDLVFLWASLSLHVADRLKVSSAFLGRYLASLPAGLLKSHTYKNLSIDIPFRRDK